MGYRIIHRTSRRVVLGRLRGREAAVLSVKHHRREGDEDVPQKDAGHLDGRPVGREEVGERYEDPLRAAGHPG